MSLCDIRFVTNDNTRFFSQRGRDVIAQSVQQLATSWTIGVPGFKSRQGLGIFLFTTMSRPTLKPTQPPIQYVPGGSFSGSKAAGAGS
jgi:hypothetical protein